MRRGQSTLTMPSSSPTATWSPDDVVWQDTVAILPWLRLRLSTNNMYHTFAELLQEYVPLVTTVREAQRLRASTQPVVYMRQDRAMCGHASTGTHACSFTGHVCSLNTSECALEMRLAERLTRIFDIRELSGGTVCFNEMWLPTDSQVFSGGGVAKYETCKLGGVDSILEWQQDLDAKTYHTSSLGTSVHVPACGSSSSFLTALARACDTADSSLTGSIPSICSFFTIFWV